MKMKIFLIAALVFTACTELDTATPPGINIIDNTPNILGMNSVESSATFEETYSALKNALDDNPNVGVVAEVDHTGNAMSVGLTISPTKLIFFGNPNLGTPLMQKNQLAGLDLPQKILVFQDIIDTVFLAYPNTEYLKSRYGLDSVETLATIAGALENFSKNAGQGELNIANNSAVALEEGIISKMSNQSFGDTYRSLKSAIEENENLTIVAEVNHRANARDADLDLDPTRLIIFGNPNLGTPLMQNAQTAALDLPQKILVWRDAESVVYVSYNDPEFLAKRHGIIGNNEILETISNALNNLSNIATGN